MKELDLILPLDQWTVETDNKFLGGRIVIGLYKTTPIEGEKTGLLFDLGDFKYAHFSEQVSINKKHSWVSYSFKTNYI